MSSKYKFRSQRSLYFITFSVVQWIDVFTRSEYKDTLLEVFSYCQKNKGLEIYAYCIMTNHVHMIIGSHQELLADIMRDMKSFSSKQLIKQIQAHPGESRKEWMLDLMRKAGYNNRNNTTFQFWNQDNMPLALIDSKITAQTLAYIHKNPVKAGLVDREEAWLYSSAKDYHGGKGLLDILLIN